MKPQNIIILHADQHRSDCLGCYGNPDVRTPHIDGLAADGVRYTSHFTVYPVCTPSRYSFLSGLYTHQHCAWTNEATLPNGFPTFPKILAQNGFHTAAIGKCHFTPTYQNVGFEKMLLSEQNGDGRYEDDYHTYLKEQGLIDAVDLTDQTDDCRTKAGQDYFSCFGSMESDLSAKYHSTTWITRQTLAEIGGWDPAENHLLMVGYVKPHHPFDPPYPYSQMYDPDSLTLPEGYTDAVPEHDYANGHGFFDHRTLSEQALRKVTANYYGAITQIDDGIGEILSLLKEKNLYDNALILYTSDHGEYLGYHHMLLKGNFLYDPLARIPLIIKYPGTNAMTAVSDQLSENIDIATTLLSCCGLDIPSSMDGLNLCDLQAERDYAFAEGQYGTQTSPRLNYMIRTKDYKLILNGSLDNCLLFDLNRDKTELHNLASSPDHQEILQQLKGYAIDKMLFSGGGKNHCDPAAPQLQDPPVLQKRAKEVKELIERKYVPLG